MEKFLQPDFLMFFIPLVGAVFAWIANEYIKQKSEMYQRKEIKYQVLLSALKGFYIYPDPKDSRDLKQNFLNELEQCWLYCPDEVIRKGYSFLNTVHTSATQPDAVKERAIGEFILAIRNDLYAPFNIFRKTALKPEDFKILMAT